MSPRRKTAASGVAAKLLKKELEFITWACDGGEGDVRGTALCGVSSLKSDFPFIGDEVTVGWKVISFLPSDVWEENGFSFSTEWILVSPRLFFVGDRGLG